MVSLVVEEKFGKTLKSLRILWNWLYETKNLAKVNYEKKRFNFLSIWNIHKDLIDELDLAYIGTEFVSVHDSRYQYFAMFENADFNQ